MPRIVRLTRYTEKDAPGESLENARCICGLGMEGDIYDRGGDRQLSLLCLETRQWMDTLVKMDFESSIDGLCLSKYRENILLDGIRPDELVPGFRLKTGEVLLEISDIPKRCFKECTFLSNGRKCFLAGQYLFAKVIHGGSIKAGSRIARCREKIE